MNADQIVVSRDTAEKRGAERERAKYQLVIKNLERALAQWAEEAE